MTTSEVVAYLKEHAYLKIARRTVIVHAKRKKFPGAFQTPTPGGNGHWRYPRESVKKVTAQILESETRKAVKL
jgi:hypothetical protein